MTKQTGTLVFAGSVAWDLIGRKKVPDSDYPDATIYTPAANIPVVSVHTSCTSCHSVLIDDQGNAYTFGRNEKGQLGDGTFKSRSNPYKVTLKEPVKFVDAATGRNHTLLVSDDGNVYASGENKCLQLGFDTSGKDAKTFELVASLKNVNIVKVACGAEFSLAITDEGRIYSWGNPQYGQLGHGSDEQHIAKAGRITYEPQLPRVISRLKEKKIVDVDCGINHSLALDDTGAIFVWGCSGYGRLGLNETPPRDAMVPTEVPGFKNRNNFIKKICSGPTSCMVTDSRDTLYVWGKWKNTGDGGQGSPWLYPKFFDGLSGWKVEQVACGGVSLFALSENCTISWGQNAANGELAHGTGKPRSATNAVKVDALDGANVVSVSCGVGHTLLLLEKEDPFLSKLNKMEGEPVVYANVSSPSKKRKSPEPPSKENSKKKK